MMLLMQPSQHQYQLLLQQPAICACRLEQPSHVYRVIEHEEAYLQVQPTVTEENKL